MNTEGCGYPTNEPGSYRGFEVTVGDSYPPDHREVPELMRRFTEFINSRVVVERYGPLVRAVLAHFYLISIHPFGDGNGRTSRALEAYLLCQGGYNVRGFYSLANYNTSTGPSTSPSSSRRASSAGETRRASFASR